MRPATLFRFSIYLSLWPLGRCAESLAVSRAYDRDLDTGFDHVPISLSTPSSQSAEERRGRVHGQKVMAYWGHTPGTRNTSLADVCKEAALDILIIGWVLDFSLPGGMPRYDFGTGCKILTSDDGELTTSECKSRGEEISLCQSLGTRVFIGVGGASSTISFTSRKEAVAAADTLWTLFGDDSISSDLQPFAGVTFDGFDFDHENGSPDHYTVFARSVRKFFKNERKQFSLAASVSCAGTDPAPRTLYPELDMINVRFFNAMKCNFGSEGFSTNLQTWCKTLVDSANSTQAPPKLYVGLLAFETDGSGYVPPDDISILFQEAIAVAGPCMGGSMLWDSTMSLRTKAQDGRTYVAAVKDALRGC